jgi:hypothetical protein
MITKPVVEMADRAGHPGGRAVISRLTIDLPSGLAYNFPYRTSKRTPLFYATQILSKNKAGKNHPQDIQD